MDLTQAALEALQPAAGEAVESVNHEEARRIRRKLLGVLIRMCRLRAERSLDDCAKFMDIEPALIEAWEYGESEPSLPQLEALGQFFNGRATHRGGAAPAEERPLQEEYMLLRGRIIGAMLRAARETSGKTLDELSASAGMEAEQLARFEFGELKLPVSGLTALAHALHLDMHYFEAAPPDSRAQPQSSRDLELPDEAQSNWRDFAAESGNLPFIRLAMAFQHIARADLHRIADALVAIIRANGDAKGWSGSPT